MLHKKQYNNKPKPLTTFTTSSPHTTNNSLHSKSTYFYQWFSGKNRKSDDKDSVKKGSPSLHLNSLTHSSLFSYSIPIACSIALLGGLGLMISPVCGSNSDSSVYAEENEDYGISTQAATDSLKIEMNTTGIGANTDSNGSTELAVGETKYRTYGFKVTSTSTNGYRLYVQAASGYTGELRGLANPKETISGVGNNIKGDNFPNNTWGYYLHEGNASAASYGTYDYKTVPANSATITPAFTKTTGAASASPFTLVFGARVGSDKPADHYQTKVLLSLAAGATEIASLSTITYMQDMDSTICSNTPIEPALGSTKQLVDKRDQKKYWVTRLKDGNCWMTQNLDYDLKNTSVGVSGWDTNGAVAQYYDPGLWVYTQPTRSNVCDGVEKLSDCTGYGWREYFGGDSEQEHYLIGNYYNYAASTGAVPTSSGVSEGIVCPENWRLPLSGPTYNNTNGSFYHLLESYGFDFNSNYSSETLISSSGQNIALAPLYFLRGGYVYRKTLLNVGDGGFYQSGVVSERTSDKLGVYHIGFFTGVSTSSITESLSPGNTIRCVAKW